MEEGSDRFAYEKRAPWLSVIGWSVAQIILGDGLLGIRFPLGMVLGSIMQSYSTWVRQVAVGAFSVFVFPLAVDFLKRMAENAGIYDQPGEAAGMVLNFFLSLSQQTWLRVTALTLGAFVAGLLLERRLQKLDRSRTEEGKDLGFEMIKFGNQLRGYTGQLQEEFMHRARRNIVSCFTTARKFGIWAPNDRIFSVHPPRAMDLIADYLMDVGTMLVDGHFSEAKQHAKSRKAAFTSVQSNGVSST